MPTKRSEEDLLDRLASLPERGGKHAFILDLADIRVSVIREKHRAITKAIMDDARGLKMGVHHPKVRSARLHVAHEYLKYRRRTIQPWALKSEFALAT